MNTADKHYKLINSKTDYVIYYHSLSADLTTEQIKAELERIKEQVASSNGIYNGTLYWEEVKK
ncbi:hypothetical protein DYU05_14535 [Mucilaginibacter terrenus]|uniref:Uncharacterized protein n=1 Tax=Mucilaginibacter terrenus TaxID=2482727 RepID=A0A3E2NQS3_9SPHI|nr:hypothetical protein [Mucilaginibacter terrenus]RFZ83349.1 hypothetical protein DYU05_14535 [Mucilaginibacter terrenus]